MKMNMLDFSILPASPEDSIDTLDVSSDYTSTQNSRYQPSRLQFLGLKVLRPESLQRNVTCPKPEVDDKLESCRSMTCRHGADDDVKELTKELDETLSVIEDKISELTRLENSIPAISDVKLDIMGLATTCLSNGRGAIHGVNGTNSTETSSSSKLESLFAASFQITERILRKAHSVSVVKDGVNLRKTKTNDNNLRNQTLSNSKLTIRSIGLLAENQGELVQYKETTEKEIIPSKINPFLTPKRSNNYESRINRKLDTTSPADSEGIPCRMDSPISCCLKETEISLMPNFHVHPLENLFRERHQSAKNKTKRKGGILQLLDCQKNFRKSEKKTAASSEPEQKVKALTTFINRRRYLHRDDVDKPQHIQQSQNSTVNVTARSSKVNQSSVNSSKQRILQTLRFKKGLVSVTSLRKRWENPS